MESKREFSRNKESQKYWK